MRLVGRLDYGHRSLILWQETIGLARIPDYAVEIIDGHNTTRVRVAGEEFQALCMAAMGTQSPYYPGRQ
jgi:hypothetical protein